MISGQFLSLVMFSMDMYLKVKESEFINFRRMINRVDMKRLSLHNPMKCRLRITYFLDAKASQEPTPVSWLVHQSVTLSDFPWTITERW